MTGRQVTSFYYYQSDKTTPSVNGKQLASFVNEFHEKGLTSGRGICATGIVGCSADKLDDPLWWYSLDGSKIKKRQRYELSGLSLSESVTSLSKNCEKIGRIRLRLGPLPSRLSERLIHSEESVVFHSWWFAFDQIEIGMANETPRQVAMMALYLEGSFLCSPSTPIQITEDLESQALVQIAMSLCQEYWPVSLQDAPGEIIQQRRELGACWPYDDVHKPLGWYWGPFEQVYW